MAFGVIDLGLCAVDRADGRGRAAVDNELREKPGAAKILLESRSPHTLLAMAEAGHGVAIIPSALRTRRYDLRIVGVTYRGKLLREPLTILWDKRRPLPPYAVAFCQMLAEHVREVFPISRPTEEAASAAPRAGKMRVASRAG